MPRQRPTCCRVQAPDGGTAGQDSGGAAWSGAQDGAGFDAAASPDPGAAAELLRMDELAATHSGMLVPIYAAGMHQK